MIPAPTTAWICGWAHEPGAFAAEAGTKTSSVARAHGTARRRPISLPIGSRVGRFKRPIAASSSPAPDLGALLATPPNAARLVVCFALGSYVHALPFRLCSPLWG